MGIGGFGMWEMIFIFMVVLLLFGAKRLPEIGSSLGKGIREFKSSVSEIEKEIRNPDRQIHQTNPPPGETAEADDGETAEADDGDDADEDDDGPRSLSDE